MDILTDDQLLDFFLSRTRRRTPKKASSIFVPNFKTNTKGVYGHIHMGVRSDIIKVQKVIRSGWEADVLRMLEAYNINYEYEPTVFQFPITQRRTKSYTPDIYLNTYRKNTYKWVEIKGLMDNVSQSKLTRFKRYYPEEFKHLVLIVNKNSKEARELCARLDPPTIMFFQDIHKLFANKIQNWESHG